jgi:acetyl esterase/lipase
MNAVLTIFATSLLCSAILAQEAPTKSPTKKSPPPPVAPTLADVAYGTHPKQLLHFWKAKSAKPTPLLFFVHGGGWVNGDRFNRIGMDLLPTMLKEGISFVSIEYRFIAEATKEKIVPPVKAPMSDAARALQFVRSKAAEWNIDANQVCAAGGSAGACSCLWLTFHNDLADPQSPDPIARLSTRPQFAAVMIAQTSLDPAQMVEWTPNSVYGGHAFGFQLAAGAENRASQFQRFLKDREKVLNHIKEYSPYEHVSSDDPPVWLGYKEAPALGKDQKDPTHTANFGVKLKEHCAANKVPCELAYPGAQDSPHPSHAQAVLAFLKRGK